MAYSKRKKKGRDKTVKTRGAAQLDAAKRIKDSNESRRGKYSSVPSFRDKILKSNRESYRKDNPKKQSKLVKNLLVSAYSREVFVEGMDHPQVADVYSVPDAAAALGRSTVGIKRWIKDGILPPPIIMDTIRSWPHYSVGELKLIAKILIEHEKEYNYLSVNHELTINRLWQSIEAWRKSHI